MKSAPNTVIDIATVQKRTANDDVAWARAALAEVEKNGFAGYRPDRR